MMWQRDTSGECPDEDEGSTTITDGSTSYTITGLEEYSTYKVTLTAMYPTGITNRDAYLTTLETGGTVYILEIERDIDIEELLHNAADLNMQQTVNLEHGLK